LLKSEAVAQSEEISATFSLKMPTLRLAATDADLLSASAALRLIRLPFGRRSEPAHVGCYGSVGVLETAREL
jgi:hypothetical protein